MFRDFYDAFAEIHVEFSEIRDLGDRIVAIGHLRTRGKEVAPRPSRPGAACPSTRTGS
jgi:hypothetical protein